MKYTALQSGSGTEIPDEDSPMNSSSTGPGSARTGSRRAFVAACSGATACLADWPLAGRVFAAARPLTKAAPTVATMRGPVGCETLGTTLMHEHVLFGAIPEDLRSNSVDFAVQLLNEAAPAGVDTLVDLTPFRDIGLYEQVARRTRVNIIRICLPV